LVLKIGFASGPVLTSQDQNLQLIVGWFQPILFVEMHQDSDFSSSSTYKYYVEFGSRSSSLKSKFPVSVPVLKISPGLDPVLINL
jgi:hypothetical protein